MRELNFCLSKLSRLTVIFIVLATNGESKIPNFGSCSNVAECGRNSSWTEVERMNCVTAILFRQKEINDMDDSVVVHGASIGWGNSIQGVLTSASIAATLGSRVQIGYPAFEKMFLPPDGSEKWLPLPISERRVDPINIPEYEGSDEKGFHRWVIRPF